MRACVSLQWKFICIHDRNENVSSGIGCLSPPASYPPTIKGNVEWYLKLNILIIIKSKIIIEIFKYRLKSY